MFESPTKKSTDTIDVTNRNCAPTPQNNYNQLDTESLSSLARIRGNKSMFCAKTMNFFLNVIQNYVPEHSFIHCDYTLDTPEKRHEHAKSLVISCQMMGWQFLPFNRGANMLINGDTLGHHWVLVASSPQGVSYYCDPLGKPELPRNLNEYVQEYYMMRFGKSVPAFINVSEKPNFPNQKADPYICGPVVLLIMMLSKKH